MIDNECFVFFCRPTHYVQNQTVYEQPLNERMRSFLRLEHLFEIIESRVQGTSVWDSRTVVATLIDVTDLLARSDVKSELIKELERQLGTLTRLQENPKVDVERLEDAMGQLNQLVNTLRSPACQPGQVMRQDELVSAIRQRISIPGGTCNFDLPGYHYWLTRPVDKRANDLARWLSDINVIKDSIELALSIVRSSAAPSRELAAAGFFQKALDAGTACQLVRVSVDESARFFPEISGGKHRFTVRFLEQSATGSRPAQTDEDVEFDLQCCVI